MVDIDLQTSTGPTSVRSRRRRCDRTRVVRTSCGGAELRSADQRGSTWHHPASSLAPPIFFRSYTARQPHADERSRTFARAMVMTHIRVVSRSTFACEVWTPCARCLTSDHPCPSPARPHYPRSSQLLHRLFLGFHRIQSSFYKHVPS